jgi:hypothetical protein
MKKEKTMNDMQGIVRKIEKYWDYPDGALAQLRSGEFNKDDIKALIKLLESITIEGNQLDRRFVSVTWFIPLFMLWQQERLQEEGVDTNELEILFNEILDLLYEILGMP